MQQFRENFPTAENVGNFYSQFTPEGYEEQTKRVNFNETYFIKDEVVRLVTEPSSGVSPQSEFFDAGAGSGTLGKLLAQHGFNNMVACDASSRFVEHLRTLGVYREASEVWLGRGVDRFPDHLKNRFDVVAAAGVWLKGHAPALGIEDCHVALKTGGYLVTALRSLYWENGQEEGYKDKFDELVAQGKLRLIHSFLFQRGRPGEEGLFAPLESRLLTF